MNVLLIEDDPGIARFVNRGLSAEGFAVEWLQVGREARERLRRNTFAAAIVDLGLPDIDGLDLCDDVRRAGLDVPILMLTARDNLEDKLEGFRHGADDYLCKPFAFEELLARLRALVRRGSGGDALVVGGLRIEPRTRAVSWAGAPIELSPREYDLLLCLARASPGPVARAEILDRVWGPTADITENTLDVYVGYLRRRFAAHGGAFMIETMRGFGFRMPDLAT